MVVLALLASWFPVNRFASLSGIVVSIGVLGSLMAATPLALLTMAIGWRSSFLIFALVNALVVSIFLVIVRDHPRGSPRLKRKKEPSWATLYQLVSTYNYWAISLSNFVRYGFIAALQSLWMAPFLIYGLGWGEMDTSYALLALGIGYMAGLPASGIISDRLLRSRKKVVLASLILFFVLSLSATMCTEKTSVSVIYALCFGLGMFAAPGQILYAHMKELVPPSMNAQAMTAVNLFTTLGAGVMTHILGFVIGGEPSTLIGPEAFRTLWWAGAVALGLVTVMYGLVPDSRALRG